VELHFIEEGTRNMWDRSWLEILWQDIRQAIRALRNDPGFTLVALAALTIGIGANASIFSVVDRVLLEPLPYQDPDSIVQLGRKFPVGVAYTASIPKYMVWRDNNVFSSMALYDLEGPGFNIDTGDFPIQVKGVHVSADYFTVFGVSPVIGRIQPPSIGCPILRVFCEGWDTRPSTDPAAILFIRRG
jgi:putative ABC transport system permease protein